MTRLTFSQQADGSLLVQCDAGARGYVIRQEVTDGLGKAFFQKLIETGSYETPNRVDPKSLASRCQSRLREFAIIKLEATFPQAFPERSQFIRAVAQDLLFGSAGLKEVMAKRLFVHLQRHKLESDAECKTLLNLIYTLGIDVIRVNGKMVVELSAEQIKEYAFPKQDKKVLNRMLRTVSDCYALGVINISTRELGHFLSKYADLAKLF